MSILDIVGETEEFGEFPLVPASLYPVRLSVDGVDTNDNGTPYASLRGMVLDGPFKGTELSSKFHYLSFGKPESKGGGIPLLTNAARVCTGGKGADVTVLYELGFVDPAATGDPKEDGFRARAAMKDFYNTLDPAERLNMVTRFLRVAEWDGSTVIVSVDCEPSNSNPDRFFNNIKGFYGLDHPKKGIKHVKDVAFADQAQEKAASR